MKYSRCNALTVISSMWGCHFKSAVIVTLGSRVEFTCSLGLLLMVRGGMSGGVLTSVAAVCSEPLWPGGGGEHVSHMVQSLTYFTCLQDVLSHLCSA